MHTLKKALDWNLQGMRKADQPRKSWRRGGKGCWALVKRAAQNRVWWRVVRPFDLRGPHRNKFMM
jgi:hypothetical protein